MLGIVTGDEYSLAADMLNLIDASFEKYPSVETYLLSGPNSNTYTQWVLDQFPEAKMHLPWNAFGKNYKLKTASH